MKIGSEPVAVIGDESRKMSLSMLRNVDEITFATMYHSFRPPLFDLKSVRLLAEVNSSKLLSWMGRRGK